MIFSYATDLDGGRDTSVNAPRESGQNQSPVLNFLFNPRYPKILLGIFFVYWLAWAFKPIDRHDWMLENALSVIFIAALLITHRRFPFSNISYTLMFIFMLLHTIGAHYTYALVPYEKWLGAWIHTERNHFDRLVHFSFGFLLAYPIRELFMRVAGAKGFWGYYLPLDLTMSFSMLYELIEWIAAVTLGGDLGQAYLGTQGDVWDAHKDMALASLGALMAMCVIAFINWKFDKNFGAELRDSLTIKGDGPLGERKLKELLDRSQQ